MFFIVYTFAGCLHGIILAFCFRYRPYEDWLIRMWGKVCLLILGIRVEVEGLENCPDRGALYLFNHTSFLDIVIITSQIKRPLRFGAKEELFRVRLLGGFLKAFRYLPIARGRREEVIKVYQEAEKRFAAGESFILAPEGTRQEVEEIGEFKSGPFVFAIEAQVPLVPVVLYGACDLMPKNSVLINEKAWVSTVKMRVLEPVETKGLSYDDRKTLADQVRQRMLEAHVELKGDAPVQTMEATASIS